ncbi:FAD dependent oxidoreductase [Aspergillus caelatus]|uniref:FAD dependent oxidoreductase n=2 Tax=Aspergillus subgen. Circumdati TaxID=2720871 RepID=A0A5N7AGK5_9EURO|nr:FAD dependent oxidoreductase [Aspergillus caelatus]KAE8369007.1 FAD dependent oxidoreductase [Aspergillus caelatus]KAE8413241.1 FAD dependent oxidoreductase [Aspergillus pseudocaelatus]
MVSSDSRIVILGGGAWGLSTGLYLTEAGYSDVTILERAETIPSPYSAAYDLNKIIRAEYEDDFYSKLALEAIEGWKTPLFGPYYHQTGYVVATTGKAPGKAITHLEKALASIEKDPAFAPGIRRLDGAKDFKNYTWQYTGPLSGFKGYYNPLAGYAHSSDTMKGIWVHVSQRGVKSILGERAGKAVRLEYSNGKVTGVTTADGKTHLADLVISALGAHSAELLPQLDKSSIARSWSVAHVQLTEDECNLLRGIPTTNIRDLGFFFEPDPKTKLFKLCPLGIGYTNTGKDGISLPPSPALSPSQGFIPKGDEEKLRQLLRETFPWMADRPFVDKKLCWFSDTPDSNYCIDFVPGTEKSVIALNGDSGHGFKMMPIFGKWVTELIAKGKQDEPRWQWRTPSEIASHWGESVSWRVGQGAEWRELIRAESKGAAKL